LRQNLTTELGPALNAIVLYGGVARGRYRPGQSDVNVLIVLNEASPPTLGKMAPHLKGAWRAAAVEPMILTLEEIERAASSFPNKFLDIHDHHVMVHGADPLTGLVITNKDLCRGVRRELTNLRLRLRRGYLNAISDPRLSRRILAEIVRPLAINLASLLRVTGHPVPADDRSATVFAAAASAFDLDRETLDQLAALRRDPAKLPEPGLFARALIVVAQAGQVADRREETGR
jgi:hypothetical protein